MLELLEGADMSQQHLRCGTGENTDEALDNRQRKPAPNNNKNTTASRAQSVEFLRAPGRHGGAFEFSHKLA